MLKGSTSFHGLVNGEESPSLTNRQRLRVQNLLSCRTMEVISASQVKHREHAEMVRVWKQSFPQLTCLCHCDTS